MLRPQCDFCSWAVVKDYRDRLKAKVVYVEGAGHAVWPYKADVARDVLAAWFHGEELPVAASTPCVPQLQQTVASASA